MVLLFCLFVCFLVFFVFLNIVYAEGTIVYYLCLGCFLSMSSTDFICWAIPEDVGDAVFSSSKSKSTPLLISSVVKL